MTTARKALSIPVARPWVGEAEARAAERVIHSGWLTQGPEVAAFEREFALAVGAPFACATSSGTTALHLALLAVGVGAGDEVIVPSHSFIATANAVVYCGAMPVFVDVEPATYNLDPGLIPALVTEKTRAILAVHQIGMPCDLARILEVGKRFSLPVIEDAACAIGSEVRLRERYEPIGRPHAAVACFSFHPRKLLTTGDGGMLTTADPEIDRRFRLWRHHGMSVSDRARHGAKDVLFEDYPVLGYNFRMTDLQAAVGREQLKRLPAMIERRRAQAARYADRLARISGLGLPREPAWARSNWQSYCVRLPAGADQRQVMQCLLDLGIATRRGVMCAHREGAHAGPPLRAPLPHSEEAQDRCLILPLYHEMTGGDQDAVAAALASVLES